MKTNTAGEEPKKPTEKKEDKTFTAYFDLNVSADRKNIRASVTLSGDVDHFMDNIVNAGMRWAKNGSGNYGAGDAFTDFLEKVKVAE